jgi:hypothetical protein
MFADWTNVPIRQMKNWKTKNFIHPTHVSEKSKSCGKSDHPKFRKHEFVSIVPRNHFDGKSTVFVSELEYYQSTHQRDGLNKTNVLFGNTVSASTINNLLFIVFRARHENNFLKLVTGLKLPKVWMIQYFPFE